MNWWMLLAFGLGLVVGGIVAVAGVALYLARSFGRSF